MKGLIEDLRHGGRAMRAAPGIAILSALTFAVGIGGTTAMFSFVSGVLLTRLPYREPERLVVITRSHALQGFRGLMVPSDQVTACRGLDAVFDGVSGLTYEDVSLIGDDTSKEGAAQVKGAQVLPDLFPLLGIDVAQGRGFSAEESEAPRASVAILSHRLWRSRFGANPHVLGRSLRIEGESLTVVGILAERVELPLRSVDVVMPLPSRTLTESGTRTSLRVFARLKDGVALETASAAVSSVARRLEVEQAPPVRGWGADVAPLRRATVGDVEPTLLVLFGAVAVVLLIAAVNVAGLLLARGASRETELAIRSALGASRGRLVRLLLAESVLLSLAGGVLGVLLALGVTELFLDLVPANLPRLDEVALDARVLAFALALSAGTGVFAGVVPAFGISDAALDRSLRETARVSTFSTRRRRLLGALTVAEVALALTLAVGGGLMMKSFLKLVAVDPGFEPARALATPVSFPRYRYAEPGRYAAVVDEILDRVGALPGVESVAGASWTPMTGSWSRAQVSAETSSGAVSERERWTMVLSVTPRYFESLGIPLLLGRDFTREDRPLRRGFGGQGPRDPGVVVVSRALASRAWPGTDPIGRHLKFGGPASGNPWLTVVGVAGDARFLGVATPSEETMFLPFLHREEPLTQLALVARTTVDPSSVAGSIRDALLRIDPELAVGEVQAMDDVVSRNVSRPRFQLALLLAFSTTALGLAAIGIYGVVSHSVSARRREIAVRLALGADRARVVKLVVREGMAGVLLGVVAGLALAFASTRLLTTFLYEVSALDAATLAAAPLLLAGVGFVATVLPARRAARADPMVTLRAE